MTEQTTAPTIDERVRAQRRFFDEVMATRPVPADVRTRPIALGTVPALEITIDDVEPSGTMLWFHGGAYVAGSPRAVLPPAANVARAAALRVLSVDYRLAPEHPFPAAVDDALAAYRAVLQQGPVEQLVVGGESAGGGLVLALLVAARDAGLPMPRAVVTFSPFTDATLSGESMVTKAAADPLIDPASLRAMVSAYPAGQDPALPLISPLFAELSGLPPLLVVVGSAEVLLDDATRLATRAAAADVAVTLVVAPGMSHVFPAHGAALSEAVEALADTGRFVRRHLDRR